MSTKQSFGERADFTRVAEAFRIDPERLKPAH